MKAGLLDYRMLAAAIRYSLPRQTGMIDLCRTELEDAIIYMDTWLIQRIAEDTEDYISFERGCLENDDTIVNLGEARNIIKICFDELVARSKGEGAASFDDENLKLGLLIDVSFAITEDDDERDNLIRRLG